MRIASSEQPKTIVLGLFLLLVPFLAQAQDPVPTEEAEGADWIRLESARAGRSPQEQTEVHILHTQALSGSRRMQLAALDRVTELIEANDPRSRFPEVTEIISLLVLEPHLVERAGATSGEDAPAVHGHPAVRIEAIELLARIGGTQAYEVILELLRVETDETIRAAAFRTLPELGVRPGPELPAVIAQALRRSYGDETALREALTAIRELHDAYGFMDTPELFTEVIDVAQGPYSRGLRLEAFELVELLRE
jgi:hypothetical protein